MRVVGGKYKSRLIAMPKGIRPTKDNVKEALFNILAKHVKGARVLDLFAGSGAIGIEALSRDAERVVFADNSKNCTDCIDKNIRSLDEDAIFYNISILTKDIHLAIKHLSKEGEQFDIIFIDPPYNKGKVTAPYHKNRIRKCLKNISIYDILSSSGFLIVEHFKKDIIPEIEEDITLMRRLSYGDTVISIYKKSEKQ